MINWHKNDVENRMYCSTLDGKKVSMPRYYKDKIYVEDERKKIAIAYAQKQSEDLDELWHQTPAQIAEAAHNKTELIIFKHKQQLLQTKKDKL